MIMFRNTTVKYGLVSKLLHWIIAWLIIGLIGLGWWMVGLNYYDKWYYQGLELHRVIGIIAFFMATLFLLWKIISPSPALQTSLGVYEKRTAHTVHLILLVGMFVMPVTGYVISISSGSGFTFFNLFYVPALIPISESIRDLAITLHYYFAYGAAAIVVLHAAAALKHQFIDKKGTLKRML